MNIINIKTGKPVKEQYSFNFKLGLAAHKYFINPRKSHEKHIYTENIYKYIVDFNIDITKSTNYTEGITLDEYINTYNSMNDFFTRDVVNKTSINTIVEYMNKHKIKKDSLILSPAESYVMYFNTISKSQKYWIKGDEFTIHNLLTFNINTNDLSLVIFRLAPHHYHHFSSPIAGRIIGIKHIPGNIYSVQPTIVNDKYINPYTRNKRVVITILSSSGYYLYYIIIGATCTNSISLSVKIKSIVKSGQRIGNFNYGGSTIIILYNKNFYNFIDPVIMNASEKNIETEVEYNYPCGGKIIF